MADRVWAIDDDGVGGWRDDPGGGGDFNGGTITDPLHIRLAAPTSDPLFDVFASDLALGISLQSDVGFTFTAQDGSGNAFQLDPLGRVLVVPGVPDGVALLVAPTGGADSIDVQSDLNASVVRVAAGVTLGFFGAAPVTQRTGVAVSAAGIHAALVSLGLITA